MGYNLTENLFGYTLVQDIVVDTATTSVTFSGLNYTAADDLLLVADLKSVNTFTAWYLYANGNTTNTNYWSQTLISHGTSIQAGRNNIPYFAYSDSVGGSGGNSVAIANIKLTNSGYFTYQSNITRNLNNPSTVLILDNWYGTSTFTASSITSLTVQNEVSGQIAVGSRFRLYKLNATKVADITVGTATTSVDITGLNITKDSEYMLVSDVVNGNSTNTADINISANGNTTSTNYYVQNLFAEATSVSSTRVNSNTLMNVSAYLFPNYKYSLSIANLKLTNNGNFVWQSNINAFYKSDLTSLHVRNGTSTFTATSITQLTISTATANAIGVGSRFQLYRLKG